MFGLPLGLLIRVAGAVAVTFAFWYAVHAYNARLIQQGVAATEKIWIPRFNQAEAARKDAVAANDQLKLDLDTLKSSYQAQAAAVDTMLERQRQAELSGKAALATAVTHRKQYDIEIARLLTISQAPSTGAAHEAETILRDLAIARTQQLRNNAPAPPEPR